MGQVKNFTELINRASQLGPARIAVVGGHDLDTLLALVGAEKMGLAQALLVGDPQKIAAAAEKAGFAAEGKVVEAGSEQGAIRAGVDLVRTDKADLLMKGKVTTARLIRAVLDKEHGLRSGGTLSQVIVFSVPGLKRLMIMSDAAINIAPTLDQKADICCNAIEVAHALGIAEPNVVLLAALEFVNPAMPATVDAAALVQMNRRGQITGAHLEGPLALDVTLSKFAADRKGIESPLVENTHIFIAPDIEAANILYRAIVYFARGESGGLIMGARVPLLVLSRAEPPETKLHSIALGRIIFNYQQKEGAKA
jgi:phosphate butyryltransferase